MQLVFPDNFRMKLYKYKVYAIYGKNIYSLTYIMIYLSWVPKSEPTLELSYKKYKYEVDAF